jgi:conjugative relaxase-like TrwC/TraI family protein
MISLHNVAGAGEALQYFSKDNYYTEHQGLEESEWFGKGAQALGLEGKVDKQAFFEALNGNFEGQELGKYVKNEKTGEPEREHRPGIDVTFSAPKSVSVVAEISGSREVREAHEGAVKAALGYIERELSNTRQMDNGALRTVQTGNITVGMFRHNTSRDLDPQTHTHAIIMNATKREDGQWRSLTNDEIYKAQRVVGAIYNAELADRLQSLGYALRRTDDRGNFEIAGITREQIEHFSQRRMGMESAMAERGIDIDQATPQQKEAAALATRARKTEVDHKELIAEWKQRAKDVGIDFDAIDQQAAANRERGGVLRDDRLTGREAMEFAAAHLIEREAVVSKNEFMRTAIEHGAGRVSPGEVEQAFKALTKGGQLVELPDGNFTTKKMLGSEQWSIEQVRETKNMGGLMLGPTDVAEKIVGIEARQGFAYTAGQREAIATVMTSHDRFVAVQGLAGTGKTTMLEGLNELAKASGYTVRGMAPTGAASKVLFQETGIGSDTVHMFMIKERELQKNIAFAQQYAPDFKRQKELWVVDESSFLNQTQKARLDYMANKAGAKVVLLGDKLQLQGVEAGKPFELAQTHGIATAHMSETNRQKTPELKAVVDTLTGRDNLGPGERLTQVALNNNGRAFAAMDKAGMVREISRPGTDVISEMVKDLVAMPKIERERTMVITAFNKDREKINEGVRAGMKNLGELAQTDQPHEILQSKGWTRAVIKEAQYYRAGDVVRFGRDYKALGIEKGAYMEVAGTNGPRGVVMLKNNEGAAIAWKPRTNNNVEVYEAKERGLAEGDLIRLTRSNGKDMKNGEIGRITALNGDKAAIEMRGGQQTGPQQIDLSKNKHWDHAYASTVHAAQGGTSHRTVFHVNAPDVNDEQRQSNELQQMAKVFGDRSFYVGVTRASHELQIYTNNKAVAARVITGQQDKTSALETMESRRSMGFQPAGVTKSAGVLR